MLNQVRISLRSATVRKRFVNRSSWLTFRRLTPSAILPVGRKSTSNSRIMPTKVTIYIESVEPLTANLFRKDRINKSSKANPHNRDQGPFLSELLSTGQLIDLLLCLDDLGFETADIQRQEFALIDRE